MTLTKEDLNAIGEIVDQKLGQKLEKFEEKFERKLEEKLEQKLEEKLAPITRKVDFIGEKVDKIAQLMNLTEVLENSRGVELNLVHKTHKANK